MKMKTITVSFKGDTGSSKSYLLKGFLEMLDSKGIKYFQVSDHTIIIPIQIGLDKLSPTKEPK